MSNRPTDDELDPISAWFAATSEKNDFRKWLEAYISTFACSKIKGRAVRVLDLGCGSGEMSLLILQVLRRAGLVVEYCGVDSHIGRLQMFRELAATKCDVRLEHDDLNFYQPEGDYDLVIASHVLQYAHDMRSVLEMLVQAGREVIVVHQGWQGVCALRSGLTGPHNYPYARTTYRDVKEELRKLSVSVRVQCYPLQSCVNVAPCMNSDSREGRALMRFLLERSRLSVISNEDLELARAFLLRTCAPHNFYLIYTSAILAITSLEEP